MDRETPTYAGLMLSLRKYNGRFITRRGFKLNAKPREIDVIIIDKLNDTEPMDNDIARIFKRHNIVELKNPDEPLNIDVIWKGISYAAQYKSIGHDEFTNRQGINAIQMKDITLTFLRLSKPTALFDEFKSLGYALEQEFPGVYYVYGMADIAMQIVVGKELEGDDFVPLRAQRKNVSEDDALKLAKLTNKIDSVPEKELIDAILEISMRENIDLYERLRKERPDMMGEALREFFKDELAKQYRDGQIATQIMTVQNMVKKGYSNNEIIDIVPLPINKIQAIRQNLN